MLTRFRGFCSLKAWGLRIAKRCGHRRACVTVARNLAGIMFAMWRNGREFRFKDQAANRSASGMPKLIDATA